MEGGEGTKGRGAQSMAICPSCLEIQADDVRTCPKDGTALVPEDTFAHVDKDLEPGDLAGEFRIEGKIGEGGFGAVYRAVHPVIGKAAAVKVLGRQFSANAGMVSRFIAEASAVNKIRHRNIIDVFSFGALPDGRQYYVMELLDGMPFDRYLDERKRLTVAQAVPILRGIARALDAAHAKGILHRDLKPENVFLVFDEDGRVEPKLLDFGLVKLMSDASGSHRTKTGTPMGTPYYMSPEQCRGLEVDRRTDVYAFGAMVFQVLTGEVPFTGDSSMDVLVKHMTQEPPDASARCPDVPREVDDVIKRMMAKEPRERPASLGEALELLVRAAPTGVALESGRLPAPSGQSHGALATVPTMMDDGSSAAAGPVAVVTHGGTGQTFLGAEADVVAAAKPRRRVLAVVSAGALVAIVGVTAIVSLQRTSATASAGNAIVQGSAVVVAPSAAASPATSALASAAPQQPARAETVQLRVEGAPAGATVSADGTVLGPAPGPFELKSGAETKLTIAAKGYKSRDVTISPTSDVVVPVSLDRATPAAPGKAAGKGGGIHSDLEGFDSK